MYICCYLSVSYAGRTYEAAELWGLEEIEAVPSVVVCTQWKKWLSGDRRVWHFSAVL